ncbi:MAG: acyl-CoA dehydratase activase-related protein [candidate division WOR-3 bacterium]
MRASFPSFGYETLALKSFLKNLGAEVILPRDLTKRTLEIGVKLSPEMICLPFKITLGNFYEALEMGADTLFMAAGTKKCRFGYYHFLQEKILREKGPIVQSGSFNFYPVSQYTPYQFVFEKMPKIFATTPHKVIRALILLLAKSSLIEDFKELVRKKRAVDFAEAERLEKIFLKKIERAEKFSEILWLKKEIKKILWVEDRGDLLKVGLVGEIYFMIEPFANQEMEKELGRMGVWVLAKRSLYRHLMHLLKLDWEFLKFYFLARRYLKDSPGGEAIRTLGEALDFIKKGVDGIIHIFPFTCMPENIAMEALKEVSKDYDVPVLSLSFDEHTSKTGLLTRLEAFVELIKRKRSKFC